MSSLYSWLWPTQNKPMKATDASHAPEIRNHFIHLLDHTDPPATFTPTDVAKLLTPTELKRLGYDTWQDAIPAIYELTWELRAFGDLAIFCKGREVPEDVLFYDIDGPIKIMRQSL